MPVLPWALVACEIAVVVPPVKGKVRDAEYDDDVLRLWCCFRRFDIPSDPGVSSGVGVSPIRRIGCRSPGGLPAVIGSPVIAVVGLALPVTEPPGFLLIDMREVIETLEDREPGRRGDGCRGLLWIGIVIGGGEGKTVLTTSGCGCSCCSCSSYGSASGSLSSAATSGKGCTISGVDIVMGSGAASVGAWAKSRESEEGPAEGVEFARDLWGNGRGAVNDSSTSGSAGMGKGSSTSTGLGSVSIVGEVTRLENARFLEAWAWVCWVQSSTSSI